MSYDYGAYANWTAKDLLSGKDNKPSPFHDGKAPADWDWQNFLNYGGDGQARALIESGLKKPEPEKPEAAPAKPKAAPAKKAKAAKKSLPKWSEAPKAKKPVKKKPAQKAKKR